MKSIVPLLVLLLLLPAAAGAKNTSTWTPLEPGLELGVFDSPTPSQLGDSKIRVVRVDPTRFEVVVLAASQHDQSSRSAADWAREFGLNAAINASMFKTDWLTSVSHLKVGDHLNNPDLTGDMMVFATGPRTDNVPPVQLIDRECQDLQQVAESYTTLVQSIRMLSCTGENVWKQQPKQWSHAVTGIDAEGRLLLIHARSPWSTHDFIEILRALPLGLVRLQYGDGGPPAQLYVQSGVRQEQFIGSYETGIKESDTNERAWQIPNVIGVRRRAPSR